MTRPYSSSSPPAAVVGQKTASQAWQQLCTGWLADNKDAAHAQARKQVLAGMRGGYGRRACVDLARTKESCPSENEEGIG